MPPVSADPKTRQWTNLVLIVVSLTLIGFATWPGIPSSDNPAVAERGRPWAVYAGAGALSAVALLAAQRWQTRHLAQVCIAAACGILVWGLVTYAEMGWELWLTVGVPGLALLVTLPFVGPMPHEHHRG